MRKRRVENRESRPSREKKMLELRLRNRTSRAEVEEKRGKIVTDEAYNAILSGPARVLKPDGRPLCVYLPGVLPSEEMDRVSDTLSEVSRKHGTLNRGAASGVKRVSGQRGTRTMTRVNGKEFRIPSAIVGSMDPAGPRQYCRLTAWTGKETEQFKMLWPLLQEVGHRLSVHVPDRWQAQMEQVQQTKPEWVIPGTPFTTVTVNNTYPTGVHTDSGDLDAGFSCLGCIRRGQYDGGVLVFPEFRLGVNMGHGDLLLMDAHEYHGNTRIRKLTEDAERLSIVCYYRTNMRSCGTGPEEIERARAVSEARAGLGEPSA